MDDEESPEQSNVVLGWEQVEPGWLSQSVSGKRAEQAVAVGQSPSQMIDSELCEDWRRQVRCAWAAYDSNQVGQSWRWVCHTVDQKP